MLQYFCNYSFIHIFIFILKAKVIATSYPVTVILVIIVPGSFNLIKDQSYAILHNVLFICPRPSLPIHLDAILFYIVKKIPQGDKRSFRSFSPPPTTPD